MATITPTLTVSLTGSRQNAADLETANVTLSKIITNALTNGVGLNQVDLLWSDTRTLDASTSEDIDLAGVLTDAAFGTTLTFARIKAILIYNKLAANKRLSIGGAASNAFVNWVGDASDVINVDPGGTFLLINPTATGYAVTASTGDILKITNASGGATTYDIFILGASS